MIYGCRVLAARQLILCNMKKKGLRGNNILSKTCKYLLLAVCFFFALMISTSVIWAGDINGDEARVIAAVSGTFSYDGKTYKAYSSYISELYSYLSADDVDLTASQADKAINYIYSNVQSGISSGYIYEVGGDEAKDDENTIDLDDWLPKVDEDEPEESSSEEAAEKAKRASDKEVEQMFQDIESENAERRAHSTKPKATETDASIVLTDDKLIITNGDEQHVISNEEHIVPELLTGLLVIISIAVLIIDSIVAIILLTKKCMRFKRGGSKRPRKGHTTRTRIRKVCRYILTATSAVAVAVLLINISLGIGIYNNNHIVQNIQSSGYFRFAYTEYLTNEISNSDDNDASDKLSYDEFLIEEKKSLETLSASDLTKSVSIAPYIKSVQKDMKDSLIISSVLMTLALIISIILNVFMDLRRDRGVKSIAVSELIGTVVTIVAAIIISVIHNANKVFIEPDYLYNFLNDHIDWITKILIIVGFFGAVIGLSLTGLYRNMRRDKN